MKVSSPVPAGSEELRQRILDVAEARFNRYGYGKTTMAEIAEDLHMSAANLYRYFENKQEIGAGCVERIITRQHEELRQLIAEPGYTAVQQLERFALAVVRVTHQDAQEQPKLNELIEIVATQRTEVVHRKIESRCNLVAEILRYGNNTGEFLVIDLIAASEAVYASLALFTVPLLLPLYSREDFERIARQVVDLMLRGLLRR